MPDRNEKRPRTAESDIPPASPAAPPPKPPDDGDHLFRHTFLWRLRDPQDREAMLRLGKGFDDCMTELGCFGEEGERMIPGMAGALADDVEALAAYSRTIARVCEGSTMDVSDVGIFYFAPKWAERLTQMAEQMRSVVAAARGTS